MDDASDLRCVECAATGLQRTGGSGAEAGFRCRHCAACFPLHDGILQMVPAASPLRRVAAGPAAALALDDGLQAEYWEDDAHGFRPPQHRVVRFFAEQRWRYLASKFPVASVKTALDVGCGDGFSTLYAPAHMTLTACDGSMTMLKRHLGARRVQADAFRLPFQDQSFDLVFAWELLHHVSEPHLVLKEMARVSRRWVICCEPNPRNLAQFLFAWYDPAHRWVLRFSRQYLLQQARRSGLQVTHFSRGGCIFPNKTPELMFPFLKLFPYRIPFIGISNILIAERATAAGGNLAPAARAIPAPRDRVA